nr:MAG TPA: hypothetical protein [Caudoviricetes sp.]
MKQWDRLTVRYTAEEIKKLITVYVLTANQD